MDFRGRSGSADSRGRSGSAESRGRSGSAESRGCLGSAELDGTSGDDDDLDGTSGDDGDLDVTSGEERRAGWYQRRRIRAGRDQHGGDLGRDSGSRLEIFQTPDVFCQFRLEVSGSFTGCWKEIPSRNRVLRTSPSSELVRASGTNALAKSNGSGLA